MNIKSKYAVLSCLSVLAGSFASYAADYLAEGHEAFLNYDFELASELYEKYAKALAKRPDAEGQQSLEKLQRQLEIADNSLDNVQKIEIIDRIDVPANDFLTAIALPATGNRLLDKTKIPFKERYNSSDFVFSNPSGDFLMWTELDGDGISHLYETSRLVDDSWELPHEDPTMLNEGGNIKNPYMLSDGITVYFAGDGDDSMGGYDLFVATKDPASGEFRQPMGVGYPFNSPFNEYMMAIDEDNGIGWWVTDRNRLDGMVSVYVFFTNDIRKNYVRDEEDDITSLASLSDISIARNPDRDYASVIDDINRRHSEVADNDADDVIFRLPGGRAIRSVEQLKSPAARRNLAQYLAASAEYNENCNNLALLRKKYHQAKSTGNAGSLKSRILELEKTIEWQRDRLKKMRNSIITAESKNN